MSQAGSGTSVVLEWDDRDRAVPSPGAPVPDLWGTVAGYLTFVVVSASGFGLLGTVLEWGAFERPWVAVASALLVGAWGVLASRQRGRQPRMPGGVALVTILLAVASILWTPLADQYCSATLTAFGWSDARVPLTILVVITAGRWWAAVAIVAFVVAQTASGSLAAPLFDGCANFGTLAGVFSIGIFIAAALFARTLGRQAAEVRARRAAQVSAQEQVARAAAVREERQGWFAPVIESTLPLLRGLGDGRLPLDDPAVRERCRRESGFLRGLMTAATAPPGLRHHLRDAVRSSHDVGAEVEVRGDLHTLPDVAGPDQATVGASLSALADAAGPERGLAMHAMVDAGAATLLARVAGARTGTQPEAELEAVTPAGTELRQWADEDGRWLEVGWRVPLSPTVGSAAAPAVPS